MNDTMTPALTMPAERFIERALYAYAVTLDAATGDLIRDAVVKEGGIDTLPVLASVIPGLPVGDIVLDALSREVVDGITAAAPAA